MNFPHIIELIGLLDVLVSLPYLILIICQLLEQIIRPRNSFNTILKIVELSFCPLAIFILGYMLLLYGEQMNIMWQLFQISGHSIIVLSIILDSGSTKNTKNKDIKYSKSFTKALLSRQGAIAILLSLYFLLCMIYYAVFNLANIFNLVTIFDGMFKIEYSSAILEIQYILLNLVCVIRVAH